VRICHHLENVPNSHFHFENILEHKNDGLSEKLQNQSFITYAHVAISVVMNVALMDYYALHTVAT